MEDKKVWIVGARETCDIVVDEPTVSGQHCRLEFVEGRLFLEDLNSTNGTFVNGERIDRRLQIHPDALVTLGKTVTFAMPHQAPQAKSPPKLPRSESSDAALPLPHMIIAGGSAATILLIVIVLVIVLRGRNSAPSQVEASPQANSLQAETPASGTSSQVASRPSSELAPKPGPSSATSPTNGGEAVSEVKGPATDAVYVLAVADANEEHRYRVGSAIAIGPHTLLTTATCKTIVNLAAERLPQTLLLGSQNLTIQQFVPHPAYVEALMEADDAEGKLQSVLSRVGTGEMENGVQEQLNEAYRHFALIDEKPHHFDLAVIQVKERIGNWVEVADKPNLAPLVRLTLLGHGFDRVAPYLPPDQAPSATRNMARIYSVMGTGGDSEDARLIRGTLDGIDPALHREMSWNGAGLVNSEGELVALYSRLTPSTTLGETARGETFDASTVADLLPFIQRFSSP